MAVVRGLERREFGKLLDFYSKVFRKTPRRYFESRLYSDPCIRDGDVKVVEEEGQIVSSVMFYRRKMWWSGRKIPFAGIANVATLPEWRGRGLSSLLMEKVLEQVREEGFAAALLFTSINSFYERFGFFTIPCFTATFEVKGRPDEPWKVREFSTRDLLKVAQLYTWFNHKLRGPVVREAPYWEACLFFSEPGEIFLLAEKQGSLSGFMRLVPGSEKGQIWEFAFSSGEALAVLLWEASLRLSTERISTAALIPEGFIQPGPFFSVSYRPSTLAMICLIDRREFEGETERGFQDYTFWWTDNF